MPCKEVCENNYYKNNVPRHLMAVGRPSKEFYPPVFLLLVCPILSPAFLILPFRPYFFFSFSPVEHWGVVAPPLPPGTSGQFCSSQSLQHLTQGGSTGVETPNQNFSPPLRYQTKNMESGEHPMLSWQGLFNCFWFLHS